jgi:hypothetical protein
MPFRRGGFALTPPSVLIFVISLVLAVLALLVHYGHVSVPIISVSHVFDVLAIAYVVFRTPIQPLSRGSGETAFYPFHSIRSTGRPEVGLTSAPARTNPVRA